MANHELMIGQNQNLSLVHNQFIGVGHNHNLVLGHSHNSGLGQICERDLHMGLSCEQALGWGHAGDNRLVLGYSQEHDLAPQHPLSHDIEINGLDLDRDDGPPADENLNDHANYDDQLALTTQNHELALVTKQDFHENFGAGVDQKHDRNIIPVTDWSPQQSQLAIDPPVLQSRPPHPVPNHELTVGQEFPDVQSCRRALRDAAIALRFEMQTIKSDKTRFTAKCATEGCPWRIHAAKLPGVPTFSIRTIHERHTCDGITHLGHHQASVQWVADTVAEHLKENPQCKPKEILEEIHRVHGIALSYKQAWRGKERIMATLRGSFEEDYGLLPQYCDQVRRTNPGSIALVYVNPVDCCFQQLFVSFQASIYGFLNACWPLIGLDKTHLRSKYLGTLLFATGFDGDGAVYPLAFGVVNEENDDNWFWFISQLHNLLNINVENTPKLTILSARQKGIVNAVEANFPSAFHGVCMHHLADSFQKEFKNSVLDSLLWEAAHALTAIDFEAKILEIEQISLEAALWIRKSSPGLWATAYFEGTRFRHLTANIVESLNSLIAEASGHSVIQMMECIRRQLMTRFNERRERSMQWTGTLVPSAEGRLFGAIEHARAYEVLKANDTEFKVITSEGNYLVDILSRSCSCRGWQLHGIPCAHAVAALLSCRQNVYQFTESCFSVANYRNAYSQTIHPIPDQALWNKVPEASQNAENKAVEIIIRPPKLTRSPPGRLKKKRVRAEDSGRAKRMVHCSRCNQTGHFRTTCTAPI